jgi:glycosyltransferase involved in cell wall biosynthesis
MQNTPQVSIIIPTYNRKHFVTDAIDSCLAQTYPNCEIIVIDDGSTDGTEAFLRDTYGERIRYIYQANQGPAIARNIGISSANGEFIHFCDADDQLLPHKIKTCVAYVQAHPDIAVVHTYYQFVAPDGKTPVDTTPFPQFGEDLFCTLLRLTGNHILISSTMIRKAALDDVGMFAHDPDYRSAEDWDLFLRLSAKYKFHGINERLVLRRMHGDMLSDDRYHGALGRLKTIQNARDYGWERCMSADEFDAIESARYHMLALQVWENGDRAQARKLFHDAITLYPPDARMRKLYQLYTYALPAASVQWTIRAIEQVKALLRH